VLHVLAVQQQRSPGFVTPPDRNVNVGVVRVVVVDGHPLEPRPEIPLHGVQDAPGVAHQIERLAALGRQDHLPHARIFGLLPAVEPPVDLHRALRSVEAEPLVALALGAFAGQVAAVGPPASRRPVRHVVELHDAALLAGARAIARPAEGTALGARASLAMSDPRRDLAEQETAAFTALGTDVPRPDAPRAFGRVVAVALHATVWSVRSRRRARMRAT
jgi:hypothetical protein